MEYLHLLPALRVRLAYSLRGQTWLAYPVNESDARQRSGAARPLVVHLVTEGGAFEPVMARGNGSVWWFEMCDRRADPMPTEHLRNAMQQLVLPELLHFPGMTPEMRTVYALTTQQ